MWVYQRRKKKGRARFSSSSSTDWFSLENGLTRDWLERGRWGTNRLEGEEINEDLLILCSSSNARGSAKEIDRSRMAGRCQRRRDRFRTDSGQALLLLLFRSSFATAGFWEKSNMRRDIRDGALLLRHQFFRKEVRCLCWFGASVLALLHEHFLTVF